MTNTENKSGYKKTKLGWIPEEWEVVKLGDLGEFKNGVNKSKDDFGTGKPFINLMDVFGKPTIINGDFSLVEVTEKEIENYNLLRGDVLFIRSSVKREGVGLTSLVKEDLSDTVYSGFIIRFREDKNLISNDYKEYCFYEAKFRNSLIVRSSSSANTNINQDNLSKLRIPLPPLKEQQKIAKILSSWDTAIQKTKSLILKKQELKKGLMQVLLTGKVRFEGFEEKWRTMRLGDVFQIGRGGSPRPIRDYITDSEDGYNWIKIGDTKGIDKYIFSTKQKIRKEGLKKSVLVREGDFILSNSMSFGRPYIMKTTGCIHDGWLLMRKKEKGIDRNFMYYLLCSNLMYKKFKSSAAGSTVLNLNIKLVTKIKVNLPSFSEQEKIASVLSLADQEIETLQKELLHMETQKKGLMQVLLTGAVRV